MPAYYNEYDPFAAQWLRELIKAGHIAPGDVDTRSIVDVQPDELRGYTQCHFFAGIGVWSYSLRLAGWPDDRPVWTGSCPCQPFSAAGKGGGFADERHLWPAFHWLISQRQPVVVLGEQVASKDALRWFDLVSADLERTGYACGAVDLCAAGVGAPHIRQRLWWVAHRLADAELPPQPRQRSISGAAVCQQDADGFGRSGVAGGMEPDASDAGMFCEQATAAAAPAGPTNGVWGNADWLFCRDGRWRAVEPGTFPLAHGAPARVGRLRGYGNAIAAPVAQAFVEAVMDVLQEAA